MRKLISILTLSAALLQIAPAFANGKYPVDAYTAAARPGMAIVRIKLAAAQAVANKSTSEAVAVKPAPAGKLTATQVQSDPTALLQKFTASDLQAALADAQAQTPPDITSAQCYTALLTVVNSPLNNPLPSQAGLFLALQKARDAQAFISNLQSPNGPLSSLNIACAPLVMSVNATLLALGVTTGLVVGTGGIAIPALPALPGLLSILPIR